MLYLQPDASTRYELRGLGTSNVHAITSDVVIVIHPHQGWAGTVATRYARPWLTAVAALALPLAAWVKRRVTGHPGNSPVPLTHTCPCTMSPVPTAQGVMLCERPAASALDSSPGPKPFVPPCSGGSLAPLGLSPVHKVCVCVCAGKRAGWHQRSAVLRRCAVKRDRERTYIVPDWPRACRSSRQVQQPSRSTRRAGA